MSLHCFTFLHLIIIRKKIEENINRARALSTYGFDDYSSYLQRNLETNRKIRTVEFVISVDLFNLPCDPPVRRRNLPYSRPVSNSCFRRIYPSAHNMYVFSNLSLSKYLVNANYLISAAMKQESLLLFANQI